MSPDLFIIKEDILCGGKLQTSYFFHQTPFMIGFAPKCSGTVGKCEHDGHRKLRLGNSGVLGNIKIGLKTRDVAKYRLSNVNLNFTYTHRFLHQFSQYVFT